MNYLFDRQGFRDGTPKTEDLIFARRNTPRTD
jgi:hypothetical protein